MTYSVADLVQRFGVREHTVLAWIHAGELKAINVGVSPDKKRPRWRITEQALADFEALRAAIPPPEPVRRRRRKASDVNYY